MRGSSGPQHSLFGHSALHSHTHSLRQRNATSSRSHSLRIVSKIVLSARSPLTLSEIFLFSASWISFRIARSASGPPLSLRDRRAPHLTHAQYAVAGRILLQSPPRTTHGVMRTDSSHVTLACMCRQQYISDLSGQTHQASAQRLSLSKTGLASRYVSCFCERLLKVTRRQVSSARSRCLPL